MGHGIGSVPTPRTQLLPTLLVSLTQSAKRAILVTLCRPTSDGSKWTQPTDGLKSVFFKLTAPSVATKNRVSAERPGVNACKGVCVSAA